MKALVIIIAFLLSFPQLTGKPVFVGEEAILIAESQENNQDTENNVSFDNDEYEIEFIVTTCSPLFAFTDQGETIYTDAIGLKTNFYFSLWRPPRA